MKSGQVRHRKHADKQKRTARSQRNTHDVIKRQADIHRDNLLLAELLRQKSREEQAERKARPVWEKLPTRTLRDLKDHLQFNY